MPRFQLPGQYIRSWGYEGSTGQCWGRKKSLHEYQPFGTGDTLGCGFRFEDRTLYFTRNGERQGTYDLTKEKKGIADSTAVPEIEIPLLRLFPTVGMRSQGACGILSFVSPQVPTRIGEEEDDEICLV